MRGITTDELKAVISKTFDKPFEDLLERRFAENNYAKYLFIRTCRERGMALSVLSKHLKMSKSAVSRYTTDYSPDVYVKELYLPKFKSLLNQINSK